MTRLHSQKIDHANTLANSTAELLPHNPSARCSWHLLRTSGHTRLRSDLFTLLCGFWRLGPVRDAGFVLSDEYQTTVELGLGRIRPA